MKKSWIIVLAFLFLYSAGPAFSAPLPVPSELCLISKDGADGFRLLLENKGTIGDTEYFGVIGSWMNDDCGCASLITGSAHREGKKKLHLGFTQVIDEGGPGVGDTMVQLSFDISYNLKKEKATMSYLVLDVDDDLPGGVGVVTRWAVDCSTLDEPPW